MAKNHSDIFDAYAKIAEEKGLTSLADEDAASQPQAPKESAKLKRYKKSPYPRAGSDDISTIEALYGVKPDNTVKYDLNIMEAAHPKPVVISPSYDRLNGLVENEIERQTININITQQPNNGNLNYKKYAEKELVFELVRLANDLDNAGREDLRVIADRCLENLNEKKKIKKSADFEDWLKSKEDWIKDKSSDIFQAVKGYGTGALIGAVIGGVVGAIAGGEVIPGVMLGLRLGGVAGGLIASIGRTAPQVISIGENAKDTVSQMQDMVKKLPANHPERNFLETFIQELQNLQSLSAQYNSLISATQGQNPNTSNITTQSSHAIATALLKSIATVEGYTKQFNDKVDRQVYEEYISHSKLLTPLYEFITNDIEDVQQSLQSLSTTMTNFKSTMKDVETEAKDVAAKAQAHQEKQQGQQSENDEFTEESPETSKEEPDYSDIVETIGHEPSERELEFFKSLK